MLGLLMFVIVMLIISLNVMYLVDQKEKNVFSWRIISMRILITSSIQVIWTIAYLFYIYLYSHRELIAIIIYFVAGFITKLTMDKKIKLRYWFISNLVISPVLTSIWIRHDISPFQGPFGSIGMFFVLLVIPVINLIGQLGIWSAIKFYNWESQGKVRDKLPLKQSLIKGVKILSFQIALSLGLSIILVINNLIVSYSVIAFSLYLIFIIRKKLGGHYIFWAISWGIVFWEIVKLSFEYGHIIFKVQDADFNEELVMICLIGFPIYHILLTVYFKLEEKKK
ncbi:hypothetical protein [Pseudolactococcus carnosus]|uniref:Uncharacterized protein n=1 Tax=Pseudolactococcus carnosus TaxID=2749961 RepID=A0ABT0AS87_9LACT|nr:hypothetical protein [Lactococcus carnosus]SCA91343.1 membrane hypothetical protein [Lactococcus piscium]MCJ1988085.1 hypothetical protein [Lactococcus carnosus]MCJ1989562.1 hypothetical protein [Lactococcus carnosus]MCJ2004962.1 hypothetical protein [Lactococcus carnosus]QDJ26501.1 hypothetical protein BHS00_08050 [Lactococcus carnosus]